MNQSLKIRFLLAAIMLLFSTNVLPQTMKKISLDELKRNVLYGKYADIINEIFRVDKKEGA